MRRSFIGVLLLLCFSSSGYADNVLEGKVAVDGKREFKGKWTIMAGTEIILGEKAVCEFKGDISIEGVKGRPVIVRGADSAVLRFENCSDAEIRFMHVSGVMTEWTESSGKIAKSSFSRSKVGLKVSKSSRVAIENSHVQDCEIGMVSELKAILDAVGVSASGNDTAVVVGQSGRLDLRSGTLSRNKKGIILGQDGSARVRSVKFTDNEAAILLHQNEGSVISGNTFTGSKVAVYGEVYSTPLISENTFVKNEAAVKFMQFVNGKITGNTFEMNEQAVFLEKKCSPEIKYNTFQTNKAALFCDFSSYPIVSLNNFVDNGMHIKLGTYQSADFENRASSYMLQMQEVLSKQSRRTRDIKKTRFVGELFAKKNYWDDKTRAEMDAGGNISTFHDGSDVSEVTYEGYGDEKFVIDKIVYKPYLRDKVKMK